jgi:chlorobactene glucosyltransferase
MNAIGWVWQGLLWLALAAWLARHAMLSWARRRTRPLVPAMFPHDVGPLPSVSFIVAGKDEEENIEVCVRSMLAQEYPNLEVIAANDRSTDATPDILDRLAAESGNHRLTVVHVSALSPGWLGKNNAMREAVARASGEWLCFTDADCTQVCLRSLRIAVNYALSEKLDFLSILPAHDTQSFWEGVVQPACSGIMMIWFNPLKVNDPSRRAAYANGAFMLMSRACYNAIGGHDAVRAEFNEDMHMARRAKGQGLRLRVVSNLGLYTIRMYADLWAIWAGWSRIFFGCFGTLGRLGLSMFAVIVFSLLPWASLAGALAMRGGGGAVWGWLTWTAAAACVTQLLVMSRFYALNHSPPAYAVFYPLGVTIGLGALVNAARRVAGRASITWRGTTYAAIPK